MKIRKDDIVLIISGKDRGKTGKVIRIIPKLRKILVEGINLFKKHHRPTKQGEKGRIMEMPSPLPTSNVKLICKKCKKAARVGYIIKLDPKTQQKGKKVRICKRCGAEQ